MGEVRSIITSCGDFPNVPLIGTKGCINYNPVLAYRQLGYAMDGPPKVEEVSESVYFVRGSDPVMLKRVTSAWKGIHKKDRTTLGKKVPIARVPYLEWIRARVKILRLPFARSAPICEQPPTVLSNTVPTEVFTQVHVENIQLRAKDREAGMKLYWVDQERADLARKLKEAQGETSDATSFRKRSHAEMEEELSKTQQECQKLQASENSYRKKIQNLEKQLKDKDAQLKKELAQRRVAEDRFQESKVVASQLLKEKARLEEYCQHLEACLVPEI